MNTVRTVIHAALGLLVGGLGSSFFTSCACPDSELVPVPAGIYLPTADSALPADYQLEISANFQIAVETYTRDGKAHEIRYSVTRDDI
ncbi:hypothetical protein [Nannocystis sp.]|uniref:hypothetical protein n=1 Tax=Nannocystis sp. TaxID=1962667 RepID=UPI002421778E|nr:hypothetical protein [Nannocystis sp.]MBK7825596.1 hypothetical protein [Nannocystis sp.]MBK9756694.1 hypothetical protein [Nannocystis sp.]